jgi:hypothetical protein
MPCKATRIGSSLQPEWLRAEDLKKADVEVTLQPVKRARQAAGSFIAPSNWGTYSKTITS